MVEIRQAKQEDLESITKLRLELLRSYPDAFLQTYEEVEKQTEREQKDWLSKRLQAGNFNLLVAEEEGKLVGMVGCKGEKHIRAQHVATVVSLGVLPAYRGKGIGKALMGKLIGWARGKGTILRLQLEVYTDNKKAIALYKKLGFREEGIKKKYARREDGTYQDVLGMAMFL